MTQIINSLRTCVRRGRDTYHQRVVIESSFGSCNRLLDEILSVAAAFAFTETELFTIRLATEEAFANAVKHGNRRNPRLSIEVTYVVGKSEIRIRVTDEGDGFDPGKVADPTSEDRIHLPRGRGLALIRAFMSHVDHNERGNSVEMRLVRGGREHEATGHDGLKQ